MSTPTTWLSAGKVVSTTSEPRTTSAARARASGRLAWRRRDAAGVETVSQPPRQSAVCGATWRTRLPDCQPVAAIRPAGAREAAFPAPGTVPRQVTATCRIRPASPTGAGPSPSDCWVSTRTPPARFHAVTRTTVPAEPDSSTWPEPQAGGRSHTWVSPAASGTPSPTASAAAAPNALCSATLAATPRSRLRAVRAVAAARVAAAEVGAATRSRPLPRTGPPVAVPGPAGGADRGTPAAASTECTLVRAATWVTVVACGRSRRTPRSRGASSSSGTTSAGCVYVGAAPVGTASSVIPVASGATSGGADRRRRTWLTAAA